MAHLATMMQGFHPFRKNDTVFQKTVAINDFYLARAGHAVSARPDPVAGAHARRDGADASCPWIPLWAYDCVGGARRRLAGDVRGSAARRTTASPSTPTAASGCTTVRTTCARTSSWSQETRRILRRLGFWMVDDALAQAAGTRRTSAARSCFGTDPRDVGARSVLPHARRREPVRRRRVVLSVVGGGESRR